MIEIAERAHLAHLSEIALQGSSPTQLAAEFLRDRHDAASVALARRLADPAACATACLVDLRPGTTVLELRAATWTNLTPLVQQVGAQVAIADVSAARLRISQSLLPEVPHTLLDRWPSLPFPDAHFDTVLCHGGLPPSISLAEITRILRPGGCVSITGPNRLSPAVELGDRRGVVQRLSPAGYRRLLSGVGLDPSAGFALFPDDMLPSYGLPFSQPPVPPEVWQRVCREQFAPLNRSGWRQGLKSLASSLASWNIGRQLAPGFKCFGRKPGGETELAGSLLDRLTSQAIGPTAQPLLLLVRLTHALVVPVYREAAGDLVYLKVALSPYGTESLARHARFLESFPAEAASLVPVPRVIGSGAYQGLPYFVESGLPGTGGGRARLPLELLEQNALATLQAWQYATRQGDPFEMRARWQRRIDVMRTHPLLAEEPQYAALASLASERLARVECAVLAHNDFHLGNVIYSPAGEVTGVLDWDLADRQGLPYCDALHLLISSLLRRTNLPKCDVLRGLLTEEHAKQAQALADYCRQLRIPLQMGFWLPIYVVTQLWRLTIQAGYAIPGTTLHARMQTQARELIELALSEYRS